MITEINTKFLKGRVVIRMASYPNGRIALLVGDLKASVNLPHEQCDKDEIFIKDYGENEGVRAELERLKIIGPELGTYQTGFATVTKHILNRELL